MNLTSVVFSIVKQITDVAFCQELPPSIKILLVFYVSLFELYKESETQKTLIQESVEENWNILFKDRDTSLMKGPRNLSTAS